MVDYLKIIPSVFGQPIHYVANIGAYILGNAARLQVDYIGLVLDGEMLSQLGFFAVVERVICYCYAVLFENDLTL